MHGSGEALHIRKTRERAGVVVEMLSARDFERLAERWSLDGLAKAANGTNGARV